MQVLIMILQVIVGLGILNVWLVRRNRPTPFRGGHTKNMDAEFNYYGLPKWSVILVGFFKVSLALIILSGFIFPAMTAIGAAGLGVFMLGAVVMHVKVQDNAVQTLPALLMLVMCGVLAFASQPDLLTTLSNL